MATSELPVALVTGASRGIGRAFALLAATKGYHVVALARTTGGLEELDDDIKAATGRSATLMSVDLSKTDALAPLGYGIAERFGRLDLFAGIAAFSNNLVPTWQLDPAEYRRAMAVNAEANLALIRTLHPLLLHAAEAKGETGSKVLFASGGAPELGRPFWTSYSASKSALEVISKSYGNEVAGQGIDVVMADPGPTATELRKLYYPGEDQSTLQTAQQAAAKLWDAVQA